MSEVLRVARLNEAEDDKDALLVGLGERVRNRRAQRGLTRKAIATLAGISERHLANLEHGVGNASILVLQQVANALESSLAELVGDVTTSSAEWLLIREALSGRTDADLRRARIALVEMFDGKAKAGRARRIALVGLRGAGKSALGKMLAEALKVPFIELSREIERIAGCAQSEIHALYGPTAYRRYERRALEEAIDKHEAAVIAAPGGLVSDAANFNLLLAHCHTVWLKASPEQHMRRVVEQGDMRPMAASAEAMEDLRRILAGRAAFYAKADVVVDTAAQSLKRTFKRLHDEVGSLLAADRRAGK
ncbi:MAG TPA: helix-turn-helix transcriptional regulator [Casimicrobiaceae bacterium]|nr:helix-turn-helix transcriptional regulator [Casimicrobiaceae bacterium]